MDRYEETLRKAKEFYAVDSGLRICLESIFPELAESEDEKIRKELIAHCRNTRCVTEEGAERIAKWIAWLEKQGEVKESINSQHENKTCKGNDEFLTSEDEKIRKAIIGYIDHGQHYGVSNKDMIAWLEKQGEQSDANKEYWRGYNEGKQYILDKYAEIEKQDKQKPTDKVEPKFKNEQWIVWQDKCYKVNDNGCGYELVDQDGLSISLEYGTIDENAHLWDITTDAKDGDVLVYEEEIFLLKHYTLWHKIVYHCCYDGKNLHKHSIYTSLKKEDFDKVYPATKEQCDLLFQKMHEARYAWDAKKKELKKIEINPAWSEEDEKIKQDIVNLIYFALRNGSAVSPAADTMKEDALNWLKSLKNRYTWKPSDEQINILDIVLTNESMDDNIARILRELREQLKNLKGE